MTIKHCNACGQDLEVAGFSLCSSRKDGLQSKCKRCTHDYYLSRQECLKEYSVNYRSSHQAKVSEYNKRYKSVHLEHVRRCLQKWKKDNPERVRIHNARRRALIVLATLDDVPADTWRKMLDFYGEHCMAPGCINIDLTLDHIRPLSKGGTHSIDNFQILCKSHNSSKKNYVNVDYRPAVRMEV